MYNMHTIFLYMLAYKAFTESKKKEVLKRSPMTQWETS